MSLFFEDVLLLLRDDLEPSNLQLLVSAMTRLGYRRRAPVEPAELCDPERRREWVEDKGMRAFTFQLPGHPLADIDVLIDSPVSYAELASRAERIDAAGLMLRIASVEDLIRMKLVAGRDQDLADVDALRRLLGDRS